MKTIRSHRDLLVWQKAIDLIALVYEVTRSFPASERYGLCSQMQRASVSIAANIAEGHGRGTRADYAHFLDMANGSAAELDTLLIITEKLALTSPQHCSTIKGQLSEVGKMLGALRGKLRARP